MGSRSARAQKKLIARKKLVRAIEAAKGTTVLGKLAEKIRRLVAGSRVVPRGVKHKCKACGVGGHLRRDPKGGARA